MLTDLKFCLTEEEEGIRRRRRRQNAQISLKTRIHVVTDQTASVIKTPHQTVARLRETAAAHVYATQKAPPCTQADANTRTRAHTHISIRQQEVR